MIIRQTTLPDAALVEAQPFRDHRGVFARFFCSRELDSVMGERRILNVNFSRTAQKGALRGMHFQRPPHQEMKLVRCIRGAVFDVLVDIRPDSPAFLKWHAETLSPDNMRMLVVPEGFAHGFQALEPDSELLYLTTAFYQPGVEGGLRWDDPRLGITWPLPVTDLSEKDARHPLLEGDSSRLPGAAAQQRGGGAP